MTKILNGKILSEKILNGLKRRVVKMKKKPSLAVVLVGDDSVSKTYVRQKEIACKKIGVSFRLFHFPSAISQEKLEDSIKGIVIDGDNSGVIVQLPLPKSINTQKILNLIPVGKDVDVLSENGIGKFSQGTSLVLPPVVSGISIF
jgi:methylenetetrahydrofolate dehydrogenase (NADP+)/methenyltetrahydrofolate cyclohydrolase